MRTKKVIIDELKSLNLQDLPFNEVNSLIIELGEIGLMEDKLYPDSYVFRARVNDIDHFYSKCQLTYKPKQLNDKCQRANTPYKTMFYGSILPEELEKSDLNSARIISTFEGVPWLRDLTAKGVKKITYSRWIVTKEIKLIAIIQHNNFYDKSSYTKKLMDDFEHFLSLHPDKSEDTIDFTNYISAEFAKDVDPDKDYNYFISAVFAQMVIDKGYDGILYPSMRVDGKGFNIALTPYAADNKLQLESVLECTAYKLNDRVALDNDNISFVKPNQTCFDFQEVEAKYHDGVEKCLKKLGVKSLEELD